MMLGVEVAWWDGFRRQYVMVGIIDEGVNGTSYPVAGGFARRDAQQPGAAPVTSHGSMCSVDVLGRAGRLLVCRACGPHKWFPPV